MNDVAEGCRMLIAGLCSGSSIGWSGGERKVVVMVIHEMIGVIALLLLLMI